MARTAWSVARGLDAKRLTDLVLSGAGLGFGAPLLAGIAVAVRLDTPGPVLFRQVRVGRGGRPFEILKFRTMRLAPVDPAGTGTGTGTGTSTGPEITASDDARITRSGRWLRASKLDELPQLINVLRGEMSLVGPRPEVPRYVALWEPQRRAVILSVRPGLTDPASIAGRDEGEELAAVADPERYYVEVLLPRKTAAYVAYVREANWRSDLLVLARTLGALVRR